MKKKKNSKKEEKELEERERFIAKFCGIIESDVRLKHLLVSTHNSR